MKDPTAAEGATPRDDATARLIRESRLVVVLRRVEPQSQLLEIVRATAAAGARIFEITLDSPTALDDIAATRRVLETSAAPFAVGAGTVLTSKQLQYAKQAGADFTVSPVLDEDILREAVASGVPFIPGALSPSEIARGWSLGATFVPIDHSARTHYSDCGLGPAGSPTPRLDCPNLRSDLGMGTSVPLPP